MTSKDFGKIVIKLMATAAGILVYKSLNAIYKYGAYSVIDDLYNVEHGFIVIPGKTDSEGNWIDQDEK